MKEWINLDSQNFDYLRMLLSFGTQKIHGKVKCMESNKIHHTETEKISRRKILQMILALGASTSATLAWRSLSPVTRRLIRNSVANGKVFEDISERIYALKDHTSIELGERQDYIEDWMPGCFDEAKFFHIDYMGYESIGFFEITKSARILEYKENVEDPKYIHYETLASEAHPPSILPRPQFERSDPDDFYSQKMYSMFACFKNSHGEWDESGTKNIRNIHRGGIVLTESGPLVLSSAEFQERFDKRNEPNCTDTAFFEYPFTLDSDTVLRDLESIKNIGHNEPSFWEKDLTKTKEYSTWYVTFYDRSGKSRTYVVSLISKHFFDPQTQTYDVRGIATHTFKMGLAPSLDILNLFELSLDFAKTIQATHFTLTPSDPGPSSTIVSPIKITRNMVDQIQSDGLSENEVKKIENMETAIDFVGRFDDHQDGYVNLAMGDKMMSYTTMTSPTKFVLVSG